MRHFILFTILTTLIACVPQSRNPLTKPGEQKIDPAVFGTWTWKDKNETGYIHIGLDEKTKQLRVLMVDIDKNRKLESSELTGHSSRLGKNTYLNLKMTDPEEDMKDYLIVKYKVTPDKLGIALMETDPLKKAIHEKLLKGRLNESQFLTGVEITDTSKNLKDFVLKNDQKLFEEMKFLPKSR